MPDVVSVILRALSFVLLFQAAGVAIFVAIFGRRLASSLVPVRRVGQAAAVGGNRVGRSALRVGSRANGGGDVRHVGPRSTGDGVEFSGACGLDLSAAGLGCSLRWGFKGTSGRWTIVAVGGAVLATGGVHPHGAHVRQRASRGVGGTVDAPPPGRGLLVRCIVAAVLSRACERRPLEPPTSSNGSRPWRPGSCR